MLFRWHCIGFFCAILFGVSWATLHKIFVCARLSQEYYKIIEQDFFLCNVVWSLFSNIAQDFCQYNIVPRVLRRIFSCATLSGASWTTLHKAFTHAMLPQCCLKTTLKKVYPAQCCLEALGQLSTKLLPVQCCPKRIKTLLNRILFCAMLSGSSLSRVFTCAMLSQEYWYIIEQDFPVHCWLEPQGPRFIGIWPVQCCLESIKTTLSGASLTTLHQVLPV